MEQMYISGKITGLPYDEAFKKFERAEKDVEALGYIAVNPMKLCPNNPDWTWEDCMAVDLAALLKCKGIYMLHDWGSSKGARCEHGLSQNLGISIVFAPEDYIVQIKELYSCLNESQSEEIKRHLAA